MAEIWQDARESLDYSVRTYYTKSGITHLQRTTTLPDDVRCSGATMSQRARAIEDRSWLQLYQEGRIEMRPQDGLTCRLRVADSYGRDRRRLFTRSSIDEVLDVARPRWRSSSALRHAQTGARRTVPQNPGNLPEVIDIHLRGYEHV